MGERKKFLNLFYILFFFLASSKERIAPDFKLLSEQGEELSLSYFKGRLVYLNFFSEECSSCVEDVVFLNQLARLDSDLLVVIGIDLSAKDLISLHRARHSLKIEYQLLLDREKEVSVQYNVVYVPTGFLIDENGKIVNFYIGSKPGLREKEIKRELDRLRASLRGKEIYIKLKDIIPNTENDKQAQKLIEAIRNELFRAGYYPVRYEGDANHWVKIEISRIEEIVNLKLEFGETGSNNPQAEIMIPLIGIDEKYLVNEIINMLPFIELKKPEPEQQENGF